MSERWRAHAPFGLLLAVVTPLLVAFAWQDGLATFNDDSFSYITLARWIERSHTFVERWAWQHSHFPPLFPLLLVATRGSQSLVLAHLTVALAAAAALVALYRYAWLETRNAAAACLAAVALALLPTAWLSILGILTEPLFLALTLGALAYHARHLADAGAAAPARHALVFGVWLAAADQTRSAGALLVAAYALHALLRARSTAPALRWRLLLPLVPVLVVAPLWPWLRPGDGADYSDQMMRLVSRWAAQPALSTLEGLRVLARGWIASFQSDAGAPPGIAHAFLILAALGIAGSVRRAARNALDGWYVLATLAFLVFWNYGEETARRLLYPVVPLLILHAGEVVAVLARRLGAVRYTRYAVGGFAALGVALCVPAMVIVALRASDRAPLPSTSMSYANVLEYYRWVNEAEARRAADPQLAALIGLQALRFVTAPGDKVMWMRPEYVGILGDRECVPYEYGWDKLTFARALESSGARYVVLSEIYKLDVAFALANPGPMLADLDRFSSPYLSVTLPLAGRAQFVLRRVDPQRLRAYLAAAGVSEAPRR
jgi:hypothetical protein